MQRKHLYSTIALGLSLAAIGAWGGMSPSFSIPYTFTAQTPARAGEVNANFTALENQIQFLNQQLIGQQTTINNLQSQLAAVQGSAVMALDPYLNLVDVPDTVDASITYPTIQFVGANLQIVSGAGSTYGARNGLGNLIIGYNAVNPNAGEFCSDGKFANQSDCESSNSGTWAASQRSGSHNLIVGDYNSYTQFGGLLAGQNNVINRQYASVVGGRSNMASGRNAIVIGGWGNTASADQASVAGGFGNRASGESASVVGGNNNQATGIQSTVSGGELNIASGNYSAVSGGGENTASGEQASVSGGNRNVASGLYTTVSGGYQNDADPQQATVSGGSNISAVYVNQWCGGKISGTPNCH